ncbi:hypothetical protein TrST_g5735 [Triparma strigata]|nr:hypothetical protein TrST_g5735 [Triparma strigata]
MFGALLIRVNMDSESLQDRSYFDVILVIVNLTPLLLPLIQHLAIVKNFKSVQVLSTAVSQVGAYFGFGGDLVAAKKQIETLKKNLKELSERTGGSGGDEEKGVGGREVVVSRIQVSGVMLGEGLGGVELIDFKKGGVGGGGKMMSIKLSDNEGPKRQPSKPAPTVRGSKVPSRKGKQVGTKGGGREQDILL